MLARVIRHRRIEAALGVHRRHRHDADGVGGGLVVLAVSRRHVHNPGAVLGGDEVAAQHLEVRFHLRAFREIRERRHVPHTEELLTGVGAEDFGLFAKLSGVRSNPGFGQHIPLPVGPPHIEVADVGVDCDALIRRQRPRRGGPDQEVRSGQRPVGDAEPDGDRRVLPALVDVVVHPQFVAGQRGLVIPAIRQHPVALVGQAFVPELLERPDHRLHERRVHRLVVVVEIHPAGLPGDVRLPFAGVLHHRRTAGIVELLDAHLFDLRFVGDRELTLYFEFGGQTVGVPAETTLDLIAAHGPVAGNDVLDVAGQQVPVVRETVRERRSVVEDVLRRMVAKFDAGPEGVVGSPVREDVSFQGRETR